MNREVRLADSFLSDTNRHFGNNRPSQSEPSINDFYDVDLDTIVFVFGDMWDTLDRWQNHPNYRFRYVQGQIVYMYYVVGSEQPDGAIELIQLEVDLVWPDKMD